MNTITTKYGTFNVLDNCKNGTIISIGDVKIMEFSNVSQWDWDSLENAIASDHEEIEKRIKERINNCNINITKENALQVLQQLYDVLGNEEKGFYSSRLKQCMNKLKSVAQSIRRFIRLCTQLSNIFIGK